MTLKKWWLRFCMEGCLQFVMGDVGVKVSVKRSRGLTRIIVNGLEMDKCNCSPKEQTVRQEIFDFFEAGNLFHVPIVKEDGVNLFTIGADKGLTYYEEMLFFHNLNRFFIDRQDYWKAKSLEDDLSQFEAHAAKIKLSSSKNE